MMRNSAYATVHLSSGVNELGDISISVSSRNIQVYKQKAKSIFADLDQYLKKAEEEEEEEEGRGGEGESGTGI